MRISDWSSDVCSSDLTEGTDDQRRDHKCCPVRHTKMLQEDPRKERSHHIEGAMREIDHVQKAEDNRHAEAQESVERAVDQTNQDLGSEETGHCAVPRMEQPGSTAGQARPSHSMGRA